MINHTELIDYINKRYNKWLDYAKYHCLLRRMNGEEYDVLNEVLFSLLQKEQTKLVTLLNTPKDGYTALDWFVIAMLNRNITSPSSPWQQKRICRHIDRDVDFTKINKADEVEEPEDKAEIILNRMRKIREILNKLEIPEKSKTIFSFKFFGGEPFSAWTGKEDKSYLYKVYNRVKNILIEEVKKNQ